MENNVNKVKAKSRWVIPGYQDPGVLSQLKAGQLSSPTVAQATRMVFLQLTASLGFSLAFGDVETAFLNSEPLKRDEPLFAKLPPGGIKGVPPGTLIQLVKPVYGLDEAPKRWQEKLDATLKGLGYTQSQHDPCFYMLREGGSLVSLIAVYVDDLAIYGVGAKHFSAVQELRRTFAFGSWTEEKGKCLGIEVERDSEGDIWLNHKE